MRDIDMPNGVGAFGFTERDLDTLVDGTLKQSRQLSVIPRRLTHEAASWIFRASLRNW